MRECAKIDDPTARLACYDNNIRAGGANPRAIPGQMPRPNGGGAVASPNAPSGFGAGGRVGLGAEDGIYGWAGAAGTVATVDMKRGIRSGIYVQFMPPTANSLLSEYQQALHADVMALIEHHA